MIGGTVTISLKDYHDLLESKKKSETLRANTERAAKEIAVFLSFMATRKDIEPYIQEFNRQSKTANIIVEDERARIQLKDAQN